MAAVRGVRAAEPPPPTHAQHAEPESLFGPGRARWVSMAEALGWGATDRPVPTVCAGGGPGGGPEPFPSGARKTLSDARDRGTWKPHPPANTTSSNAAARAADCSADGTGPAGSPAAGVTPTLWRWTLRSNNQANATIRAVDEPAATLFFGHRANECVWQAEPVDQTATRTFPAPDPIRITAAEAGLLQTFPADYPWQGNKGQVFSQVGNAVPPRLAAHLLAPHLGKTLTPDNFTLAA